MHWPVRPISWPALAFWDGRCVRVSVRVLKLHATRRTTRARRSGAAEFPGNIAQVEPRHLVFERAQGNAKVPGSRRDVPVRLLQRPQDEIALEGVARFLEEGLASCR